MKRDDIIVGLDIGTTKVCALVGERVGDRDINVRGVGVSPSRGLRKGMVVNLESTVDSIATALEEAERTGKAAIQLEGQFIDYAVVEKSRRIVELAEAIFGDE